MSSKNAPADSSRAAVREKKFNNIDTNIVFLSHFFANMTDVIAEMTITTPTMILKFRVNVNYTITNLDSVIKYYFYTTLSTFYLLIKVLALLFYRLSV